MKVSHCVLEKELRTSLIKFLMGKLVYPLLERELVKRFDRFSLKKETFLVNFSSFFFRHEVPVSSEEIKIVHIDDDLVVVNKPASIPVRTS